MGFFLGSRLEPIAIDDPFGLYIRMDGEPGSTATTVRAPIAPGAVSDVDIMDWRRIMPGEQISIDLHPGTIALDGERKLSFCPIKKFMPC
ncbi:MAG: hypothetical protein Ct9H300mP19_16720 [Dehalococcoidia bacterium]|nr:MAG: hypothetical protein Ct9H300mP19_16720 [Dehalococcoidia bacterium]